MLTIAFGTLTIAVLLGSALAFLDLREGAVVPPWWLATAHALLALGGLGCLLFALTGPPRGEAYGTASFGAIAAALMVPAAVLGGAMLAVRCFQRRPAGILIAVHAMLAVSGFVILTAYVLVG